MHAGYKEGSFVTKPIVFSGHRLILNPGSERAGTGIEEVMSDIVHQVPLPDSAARAGWRAEG